MIDAIDDSGKKIIVKLHIERKLRIENISIK